MLIYIKNRYLIKIRPWGKFLGKGCRKVEKFPTEKTYFIIYGRVDHSVKPPGFSPLKTVANSYGSCNRLV